MEATATPATPAQPSNEPAQLIAGKFKSVDDLVKSYTELEKKLGTPQPTPTPATSESKPAGLDLSKFSEEFNKNGSLSDESYKALEAAGLTREIVDSYVEGQRAAQALPALQQSVIKDAVGGEESYGQLVLWASKNLSPEEQAAFNAATEKGFDSAKQAVLSLHERFTRSVGTAPSNRVGESGGSAVRGSAPTKVKTVADLARLMQNPLYGKDETYTREVEEIARNSELTY